MTDFSFPFKRTGLLVSVRNRSEALTALSAGAAVIDVKDPRRGALGRADTDEIARVVEAVAGRAPVTAALGELTDLAHLATQHAVDAVPRGVSLFKIGLAGCGNSKDWPLLWRQLIHQSTGSHGETPTKPVAVVYADWKRAHAPEPDLVLSTAIEFECPALLVDTWSKTSGSSFDHWTPESMIPFIQRARQYGLRIVLAGSLGVEQIPQAMALEPDLLAVRGAVCEGGRDGVVSHEKVKQLKQLVESYTIFGQNRALNPH
jgi:(5-formylfuran-3-yl)methyl phosphate synthase